MTDHSIILREIGLTPIWLARTPVQLDVAGGSAQPTQPTPVASPLISAMTWDQLAASIANCTACKLSRSRSNTVPGTGDHAPAWMVIGAAPDAAEEQGGEPFVGAAGQLLDAMLIAVGKTRNDGVYLTHLVKCRPPENRDPAADEILACAPYLKRQIELATPKLLLAAGEIAARTLLNRDQPLALLRGADAQFEAIPVAVTYHPAYLLDAPLEKARAWEDLVKARATVA